MIGLLLWLLGWAATIGISGYALFMALMIAWRTLRVVSEHFVDASAMMIHLASRAISNAIIDGFWIIGERIHLWLLDRADPFRSDPEVKKRQLAALSNSLSGARDILGLPESFTKEDLSVAYRSLAKRADPNAGGTEGLLKAVNLARDVLKAHAS